MGGFEEIAARVRALRNLWEAAARRSRRTIVVGRRGPQGGNIKKIGKFESEPQWGFIAWQIKNSRLFSVQTSPFFPDGKAALCDLLIGSGSNEAWLKWLPRLNLGSCDPRERRDLEAFALGFGAKDSVTEYSLDQWRGWLSGLAGWPFEQPPINELRGFVHALSRLEVENDDWAPNTRLPCVDADETLVFSPVTELTILDEPRFEGFKLALLKAGHRVLLASVAEGRLLLEMFGCKDRAVSALVRLDVAEHRPCELTQERLRWCGRVRPLVLAWVEHVGGRKAADRLRAAWAREIRAHNPLEVNVVLAAGGDLGRTSQPFLWEDDILHVDAGEGHRWRLWDNVAAAFEQQSNCTRPIKHAVSRLFDVVETAGSADVGRQFLAAEGLGDAEFRAWEDKDPRGGASVPVPDQSSLPQSVTFPNSEPGAKAVTSAPADASPRRGSSPTTSDHDDDLPITLSETPRKPRQQPISGSPTCPDAPTQAPRAAPTAEPETGPRPAQISAPPDTPKAPPPSRPRGQEPQQHGQAAEAWFRVRLAELIGGDFRIEHHDRSGGGETDLVISADDLEILHVEVKLMTKSSFYWSREEVSKAQSCAARGIPYALAILKPDRDEEPDAEEGELNFRVKWIPEPARRLASRWKEGRVSGEWRWRKQTVPGQTLQSRAAWTPSTPPKAKAQGITFVIVPGDGDYAGDGLDYVLSLIKAKREQG
ncbi:hypothetical protein [uncultured Thiodictyon sp.]|uniref:hypothetical protein n=1 Tax=uncultured Thiodictyon sp. TaxID=1846217 RepID=UPI0025FFAF0D|nr:hypothetical protein [uncultured Thiodictyon sp.]